MGPHILSRFAEYRIINSMINIMYTKTEPDAKI